MNKHIILSTFLLLFWSCLVAQIDHWETVIYADDTWTYRNGYTGLPNDWNQLTFSESGWLIGNGGIGYGDSDDNTIINPTVSVYIRRKFNIIDVSTIEMAILHADYDDGFVAYINGVEVARSNMLGDPPSYFENAIGLHEAQLYSGGVPEDFILKKSQLQDIPLSDENVLAIQIHNYNGTSSSDLSSNFYLSIALNNSSNNYRPTPSWFTDPSFSSPLPIVKIYTDDVEIPDEPPITAEMGIVWNGLGQENSSNDVNNEFLGNISIERRGQSSLALFPKTGFAIETKDEFGEDMDTSFLNFPAEEDWVLHGPYSDKSLMRNVLTMHLAESLGQYASRTRFVELMINDQYEGIYVMMEKIKRDKNRVDIAKLKEGDLEGDELTGGYVFKIDKGEADWYSQYDMENIPGVKLPFQYVSPKRSKIQPEQEQYIQSYVDSFEQAIHSLNWSFGGKRYDEYIDLNSFVDNFIINELSKNIDAFRLSSYFHKDKDSKGGKIKAGPVWDFNLSFGNAEYCNGGNAFGWIRETPCGDPNPFWWSRLIQDPTFTNLLKCRWEELKDGLLSIDSLYAFIDEQSEILEPALERNYTRWPVLGEYVWPNAFVFDTYEEEVAFMKSFISDRHGWIDANIYGNCTSVDVPEVANSPQIHIQPNPVSGILNIYSREKLFQNDAKFIIHDMLGQQIKFGTSNVLDSKISLEVFDLPNGVYQITILGTKKRMSLPFVVVN